MIVVPSSLRAALAVLAAVPVLLAGTAASAPASSTTPTAVRASADRPLTDAPDAVAGGERHRPRCRATNEKEIARLFDRWNASLATGRADTVVRRNYAPGSVLLPTLSNVPRDTPEEQRDYFTHFLAGRPTGRIVSRHIDIDCRTAVDAGLYTFTFGDGRVVPARYTFTYRWTGHRWLITSHHSSAMPEATPVAPHAP
ncbi:hypothetical protein [Agilicoccus flavus]|uniref:hypothetical protein n=1 Tax=Agilicoccus flavus TaxID=2775968 RepID=UPI001CF6A0B0|nr:hypothetical protein [Agilicoccus flavus]